MNDDRPVQAQQVAFADGHLLDVATLDAMQQLHLEEQRRHLVRQHGAGVVDGMALMWFADRRELHIAPGLAVDCDGHVLRLTEPRLVKLYGLKGNLDIWAFAKPMVDEANDRRVEQVEIVAEICPNDTRASVLVLASKTGSPVPPSAFRLCRMIHNDDGTRAIHAVNDQNGNTMAARITAPHGKSRIELDDGDSVFTISDGDHSVEPALSLSRNDGLEVGGDMTIRQGHRLCCRGLDFAPAGEETAAAREDADHVMSIGLRSMKVESKSQGDTDAPPEGDAPNATQLCWSIAAAADLKTDPPNRIRIGKRGSDGTFEPIVTIQSDGRTVIEGDLHYAESMVEGPIDADVGDQRFLTLLRHAWRRREPADDQSAGADQAAAEASDP